MKSKKKVLVLATTFPRWKNDTTPPFVYELSKRLTKEFDVYVLAPHYQKAKTFEIMEGMKVYRFKYFLDRYEKLCYEGGIFSNIKRNKLFIFEIPLLIVAEFFATRKLIKKLDVELIHSHWVIPQGTIAYLMKRFYGIPYITSIHGGDIYPLSRELVHLLRRISVNNSLCTTINSTSTLKEVEKIKNIDKSKLLVLPMGVDMSMFKQSDFSKLKKRFGNNKIILFVGRLVERKGVQYLIRALKIALNKNPNTILLIAGKGEYEDNLKELVEELNLKEKVVFLGALPHNETVKYYNIADIFVLPSVSSKATGYEGLGVVLIEAMACGTNVIGSNVGGIPDIIIDKKTGLLFEADNSEDLAEKIDLLLNNKSLSKTLAKNAKQHIKKFSWENISTQFIKILKQAANGK